MVDAALQAMLPVATLAVSAADAAGIYAAALSTALAGWQVYRLIVESRPDLVVSVTGMHSGRDSAEITAKVVNRSAFPVTVVTVQAEWVGVSLDPLSDLVRKIEPHDYAAFTMRPAVAWPDGPDISDINYAVARVRIATGEWFMSRPTQLFSCDRLPHEI